MSINYRYVEVIRGYMEVMDRNGKLLFRAQGDWEARLMLRDRRQEVVFAVVAVAVLARRHTGRCVYCLW